MEDSCRFGYWEKSSEELLKTHFPLHHACREGDVESLSLLLVQAQHGIYVEDSFYGWTPAHWAAYFGKLNCLMCLLEHGVNCDVTTIRFNQTPAHIAAFGAHSHCLKWLLHCGATINRQDYLGETPVHKAARTGSMECVSLLASHGANLVIPNNNGHIPSQLANMCGYRDCAEYLNSMPAQQEPESEPKLVPPVISSQQESPLLKQEKCVITQGLNGGIIPPEADTHTDMEMEECCDNHHDTPINGFHHLINGTTTLLNGGSNADVTLNVDVSQNRIPIAGKKRAREEFEDMGFKRARKGEPVFLNTCNGLPVQTNNNGFPVEKVISQSVIEHQSIVVLEQGYDSMFYDSIAQYNGYDGS